MTAIKARGETPFPAAGEGVVLCYTFADLKRIQEVRGKNWVQQVTESLLTAELDFEMIEILVKHGAKKDRQPFDVMEVLDRLPIADVNEKILDALYVAIHGKTFTEFTREVMEKIEEATAKGEPLPSLESPDTTSSTISDESPSGPASA